MKYFFLAVVIGTVLIKLAGPLLASPSLVSPLPTPTLPWRPTPPPCPTGNPFCLLPFPRDPHGAQGTVCFLPLVMRQP